jgi:hypothetical protein
LAAQIVPGLELIDLQPGVRCVISEFCVASLLLSQPAACLGSPCCPSFAFAFKVCALVGL